MHHPQKPALLHEFNVLVLGPAGPSTNTSLTHSLACLDSLVMAPGVIFDSDIASSVGAIVQCTIHKNLHCFTNSITHSTHSLACLDSLVMAPGVIFESDIASSVGVIV